MYFLVDAQLPPALALKLRELGFAADDVSHVGLLSAADQKIWIEGGHLAAIIVTKDDDFAILRSRSREPSPRVLLVGTGNISNRRLIEIFEAKINEIAEAFETGELLVEMR
jgi:predicted nuclease of predicted toxin-antitoxin system